MDSDRYLSRIGLDPTDVRDTDLATVGRLQQAHLTTVPFESLSVAGDPFGERRPAGVSLDLSDLYEKIVERQRGGICYELNTLFGWLLDERGFDVNLLAAWVVSPEDGTLGPPGDHQPLLVLLDDPYVVDVGFGGNVIRHPLPLDGTAKEGPGGAWRLAESDRGDADYVAQSRGFDGDDWTDRFVFRTVARDPQYFEPACEYHQRAPDATFTDWALVTMATDRGHKTLTPKSFVEAVDGEKRKRSISEQEWRALLKREFGIQYPAE